ncbi:MAG: FAD-dependent oxidoreductase [Acidobacteriota bacterium]
MAPIVRHERRDVVVVGGGPAGVCAAVSAARAGRQTLLIEKYGFLGGMATTAMFAPWKGLLYDEPSFAPSVAAEIINKLEIASGCRKIAGDQTFTVMFDVETLKSCLQELVLDAGADLLLHTHFLSASVSHAHVTSIIVQCREGAVQIDADVFIDATGNGDLAASCGEPFSLSGDPVSYNFSMINVDCAALTHSLYYARERIAQAQDEWRASSPLLHPRTTIEINEGIIPSSAIVSMIMLPGDDVLTIDGLTRAELKAQSLLPAAEKFLRAAMPGFAQAQRGAAAPQIGFHSTRLFDSRRQREFDDEEISVAVPGSPEETTLITSNAMRATCVNNVLLTGRLLLAPELLYSTNNQPASMALGETAGFLAVSL